MSKVRKGYYRKPPTPAGLKAIEKGKLTWYDDELVSNFNTGTLEGYLDEYNREHTTDRDWKPLSIFLAMLFGLVFVLINQYIGLKFGMMIGGAYYVVYFTGLTMRWSDRRINLVTTGTTSAATASAGFVFTYPALYIMYSEGTLNLKPDSLLLLTITTAIALMVLSVLFTLLVRRLWIIDDPLPFPGFEAHYNLYEIAKDYSSGGGGRGEKNPEKHGQVLSHDRFICIPA